MKQDQNSASPRPPSKAPPSHRRLQKGKNRMATSNLPHGLGMEAGRLLLTPPGVSSPLEGGLGLMTHFLTTMPWHQVRA